MKWIEKNLLLDTIFIVFFKKKLLRMTYINDLVTLVDDEIIINTETYFYIDEKLFELFCIENNFVKYYAKCRNLFKYFVLYSTIILQGKSISLHCIVLQNPFLAPE